MERPALRQLINDIEDGRVDCVVVYKVDRLSRSLMDFARIIEVFDRHGVAFVSVTQQFNTATSMGRLILNVLLSFAQFEREMISERTRDKIAATRRKGKWSGGMPLLGYAVENGKLVVVPAEAERVRQIYDLYLKTQSLIGTVKELNTRGWETKRWVTKSGAVRGGKAFTKSYLYQLLTNVTFMGKVRYKKEVHDGEHQAIIEPKLFARAQKTLRRRDRKGQLPSRRDYSALLRGILHCVHCQRPMGYTYTNHKTKRYRYYVCKGAQQKGYDSCPAPSVTAAAIEEFVIDEVRQIGHDNTLAREVFARTQQSRHERLDELNRETASLQETLRQHHAEFGKIASQSEESDLILDLQTRITRSKSRLLEIKEESDHLRETDADLSDVQKILCRFDDLWESMPIRERARLVEMLIERIDFDGQGGKIRITFYPTGIAILGDELAVPQETVTA